MLRLQRVQGIESRAGGLAPMEVIEEIVLVQCMSQVVAQSDGRWEDRDTKSIYDAVLLNDSGQVSEVRFAGQKKVFVFSE